MANKKETFLITAIAVILDIIFVIVADIASFAIRFGGTFPAKNFTAYLDLAVFIVILRIANFYIFRLYDKPKHKNNFETALNTIKASTSSSVIIISVLYFLGIEAYPRSIAILSWFLTILFIVSWRATIKMVVGLIFGKDFFCTRLLIIGTGRNAHEIAMNATMDAASNYRLLGFIDTGSNKSHDVEKNKIIGSLDDLPYLLKKYAVDEVIIAEEGLGEARIIGLTSLLSWERIQLRSAPASYENVITNMVLYENGVPFTGPIAAIRPTPWYWGLKRLIDILVSLVLLALTSPILLVAMILIKTTSQGPVFYTQKRTGFNGRSFVIYKLRTMRLNAERGKKPRWAKKNDLRITPVGKFLRRYRIDELPQLLNVLNNDMSIVGPRPERPYFTYQLMRKVPFYAQRLQAKPGLTGWAQVNLKYTDTEKGAQEKLLYDLFYIHNASFALDSLILLKTFQVVLAGKGAH